VTESSPSLTLLQRDLIEAFFDRDDSFVLTGGAALAGYYLRHRTTNDLDLFGLPGADVDRAEHALADAADAIDATVSKQRSYREFRRFEVRRGAEITLVDLAIDRAAPVEAPRLVGRVRIHTLREMAANKLCTVLSRSEPRDLVDLLFLSRAGVDLEQALRDAQLKDGGLNPAALAWVLGEMRIGPAAVLPTAVGGAELDAFRQELERQFRALAVPRD